MIKQCQFYTNVLPMYQYYAIRKISFLSNLPMTRNQVLQTLHDSFAKIELLQFASMFECEVLKCCNQDFQDHYSEPI